jgi:hypothetical protein
MLRYAALMALIYSAGLAGFETLVNWGQWQWWPLWLVDYVAAAMLAVGAIGVIRHYSAGAAMLAAAWGFALGMMWMSLAGNIEAGVDPDRAARVAGLYIVLIAFSMAWCMAGLTLTLWAQRNSR